MDIQLSPVLHFFLIEYSHYRSTTICECGFILTLKTKPKSSHKAHWNNPVNYLHRLDLLLLSLSFSPLSLTLTFNLTSSLLPPATHLQTAGNNYGLSGLCGLQMADKRKREESGQSIRAELRMSNGNLMGGMGFQEAAATRCPEGHVKMCHGAQQINWESFLLWDLD